MRNKTTLFFAAACIGLLVLTLSISVTAQDFILGPFVAWSPDGTMVAVAHETTLQIIDADTMSVLNTITDLEVMSNGSAWSPDGSMIAVINGYDVEIWSQPWNSQLVQHIVSYKYYADRTPPEPSIYVGVVAWSPDGSYVASNLGRSLDIWQSATGNRLRRITGDWSMVTDLVWTPDNRLALATIDTTVAILNPDTGEVMNYFYRTSWDFDAFTALAFSPDGDQAAVGTDYGGILIWEDTRTSELWTTNARPIDDVTTGHTERVSSLSWSSDGQYLASSGFDGTVRIWDPAAGELLDMIEVGEDVQVNSVAWRPGSNELAYGEPNGTVEIVTPAIVNHEDESQ